MYDHGQKSYHNFSRRYWVTVMVVNATFNNISYIVVVSFIGGGNQSTQRVVLPQITENFVSNTCTPHHERFKLTTLDERY